MRKEEFEALTGTEIPEKEYEVIEYVYQFHPVVSETSGKEGLLSCGRVSAHPFSTICSRERELQRRSSPRSEPQGCIWQHCAINITN